MEVVDHVLGCADHRGAFQLHLQVETFCDHSFSLEWVHSEERAGFTGVAEHANVASRRDVLGFLAMAQRYRHSGETVTFSVDFDHVARRVAGGNRTPGPHRSGREPLGSSGSCRLDHQAERHQDQWANRAGHAVVTLRHDALALVKARNRSYFRRIQRSR